MRLVMSDLDRFPELWHFANSVNVFLDGQLVEKCVGFDEERGWVAKLEDYVNGDHIPPTEHMGNVEVRSKRINQTLDCTSCASVYHCVNNSDKRTDR